MKLKLKEKDIARTCGDLLALDGWRLVWCEPVSNRAWGKGFGEKGMPDLLAIRYLNQSAIECNCGRRIILNKLAASTLWIEWKRPYGKVSPHQKLWHEAERVRGAMTLIAGEDFPASIEGFINWYRGSGLNRGKV